MPPLEGAGPVGGASSEELMASVLAPMGPALARLSSPEAALHPALSADPFAGQPAPGAGWALPGDPGTLISLPVGFAPTSGSDPMAAASAGSESPRTIRHASRRDVSLASMVRAGLRAADSPIPRIGLRTGPGVRPTGSHRHAPDPASSLVRVGGTDRTLPRTGHAGAGERIARRSIAAAGVTSGPSSARAANVDSRGRFGTSTLPSSGLRYPTEPAFEPVFPAPAALAAESFDPVRRTLVRSLGVLPPPEAGIQGRLPSVAASAGASHGATAGASDLVEWIRLQGGGRPVAGPDRRPGSTADGGVRGEGARVEAGSRRTSEPVRPVGIQGTLPGLPDLPAAATRFNVSLPGRGLASPGGASTSFANLMAPGAAGPAGPMYHGTHALVSTALSSVAATARLATTIDEPAAQVPAQGAASEAAAAGAPAVDLDGLAAEMSERILRRLKRDKERRGFYG